MKIPTVVALAAVLTLACVLALKYEGARGFPSDFRDAVRDELEKAVPGSDLNLEMPAAGAGTEIPAADEKGVIRVFSQNDPWLKRLAEAAGTAYPCNVEIKKLGSQPQPAPTLDFPGTNVDIGPTGGPRQILWKYTFDDGRRKESVVLKRFGGTSLANQWFMKMVSLGSLNYEHSARKMYDNGLEMTKKFRAAGLNTLEVVLVDTEKMIMVTRFAKGDDMDAVFRAALRGDAGALQSVEKIGSALGAAHRNTLAVGDFNTGNGMIINGEFYFVDLDRASVGDSKGWDIVLPFYHAILMKPAPAKAEDWAVIAGAFLKGYLAGGGEPAAVKEALSQRYSGFLAPITAIRGRSQIGAVRREMKLASGGDMTRESEEVLEAIP